jgi:gamma-glutamylcyclotransferase (GGCT)/AIG2-like uncharacterized protein YtfP
MNLLPLFVYGTLRRGQCNHHHLAGKFETMLPARLRDFGRSHPLMIVRRSGGVVEGELYFLKPENSARTMAACDRLEGIPVGGMCGPFYRRACVAVETADGIFDAWAYIDAGTDG